MPLYEYGCSCGARFERYLPVAQYADPQVCACGKTAEKRIGAALVVTDLPGYRSPVDGKWIEGRRARREDLARNNCVPYDPSMPANYMKRLERDNEALGRRVEETFDAEIERMPARKRELLEQELRSGADLELTRA